MLGNQGSAFSAQVNEFKNLLIRLYQTRTKFIAERESLRFRYISEMKARMNAAISSGYEKIFRDKNADAEILYRALVATISRALPMTTLNGQYLEGYNCIYCIGGRNNMNYLSPMSYFLQEPYDANSEEPIYRDFPFYVHMGQNFLTWPATQIMNDYVFARMQKNDYETGNTVSFSFPITEAWAKATLPQQSYHVISQFNYVMGVMESSGLLSIFEQMFEMLHSIIHLTGEVLKVQIEIDQVEDNLKLFIDELAQYGEILNKEELLQQIRDMSEGKIPVDQPPTGTIVATTGPAPVVEENSLVVDQQDLTVPVISSEQQKSLMPWVAAAAGLLLLARK